MEQLLKVIVGSQAHGLSTPESDFDYRGVFVMPTSEIIGLGGAIKHTNWIEGNVDDTSFEIGHFLFLATKCNPTILETFLAPVVETTPEGDELRSLFPHLWNSKAVMDAFCGYGMNQRKKFLEEKDGRPHKYAAAYIRSLYNAYELITTGKFTVKIADTEIGDLCRRFKNGDYTFGEVIDQCRSWEQKVREAYEKCPKKEADLAPVNDFLLRVRKAHW